MPSLGVPDPARCRFAALRIRIGRRVVSHADVLAGRRRRIGGLLARVSAVGALVVTGGVVGSVGSDSGRSSQ